MIGAYFLYVAWLLAAVDIQEIQATCFQGDEGRALHRFMKECCSCQMERYKITAVLNALEVKP